ncbi:MAG: type II toxin-antitoxin system VapC family toxin [Gammaproteobacteria bacterium]|nr:type II toxin-antitoxin system VapC family toxin [Gammaproteobacteria bacterium]
MQVLLDTSILLMWLRDDKKLPKKVTEIISDADNDIFVSAANVWEISRKKRDGAIDIDMDDLTGAIKKSGFEMLPLSAAHTAQVDLLPEYHDDLFDRLLLAQSAVEPMRLLTRNKVMKNYGGNVILV